MVQHILLHCPDYANSQVDLIQQARTKDLQKMLSKPESAKVAARWFVQQGILEQFNTAKEIKAEDVSQYMPFQGLEALPRSRSNGLNGRQDKRLQVLMCACSLHNLAAQ